MSRRPDFPVARVVLAALAVTTVWTAGSALATSSEPFGVYNPDWDGTADLRAVAAGTGATVDVVRTTAAYERVSPDGTTALVLSPDAEYAPSGIARVRKFVRDGGTLVVAADDREPANTLLRALGASARLDGRLVRDERSNYRSPTMPVADGVVDHPAVAGVESVALNYGTVVRPGGATVLVNSSEYAYLDADRNGRIDGNESLGSRPVVTLERLGDGRIVVVSDASVFINAMLDRPGNRQFARAVLFDDDRLIYDGSHAGDLPPLRLAVLVLRESPPLQFGVGIALVALLAVLAGRPDPVERVSLPGGAGERRSEPARPSRTELLEYLERQHPDWRRDRLDRVVTAVERRRKR